MERIQADVTSEIGTLEAVVIHTPGPEVENMTPQNAERALYSDILNLSVVSAEYSQFRAILNLFATTLEISTLLKELLSDEAARDLLLNAICENEEAGALKDQLLELPPTELTRQLLEGVPLLKNNLTRFLSKERYSLEPLHNFFFTRDASITLNQEIIIALLASQVRKREAIIMAHLFEHHTGVKAPSKVPPESLLRNDAVTLEGGDVLVAREDVLLVGNGARSSTQGVDYLLEHLKTKERTTHLLVQQLPHQPESFIHLDMVFTFLDRDACLIYEPVVLNRHDFKTVHIVVDGNKVSKIFEERDLVSALNRLGIEVEPILCGGDTDSWTQEREQWHSGANFLAIGPGKVIGYGRNSFTMAALSSKGFEILDAREILSGKIDPHRYSRFAIAVEGSELSRGGGGCRCMTMPLRRAPVEW